ncbi:MAG: TRAP transporter large permease subunit [Veillonellales bacterium]
MSNKTDLDKDNVNSSASVASVDKPDLAARVDKLCAAIVTLSIIAELIIVPTNIITRNFLSFSLFWTEEIGNLALIIMAFIGGAVAYNRKGHMAMKVVVTHLSQRKQAVCEALGDWTVFAMGLVCFVLSQKMMLARWEEVSPILKIREAWFISPIIIGMILFCVFAICNLRKQDRKIVLSTGVVLAIVVAVIAGLFVLLGRLDPTILLCLVLAFFFTLLIIGVPIAFVLILSSIIYILFIGKVPLTAIPHAMHVSMGSFLLLAIPFFMLAGYIMTAGGLSRRIADSVIAIMGHMRGGLLYVIVVFTYLVSGLSGSKLADVAAVGTSMSDALDKYGYKRGETSAVLAASAIMGETVPPCMCLLVLASNTTLSVGSLFIAGIIPAAVIGIAIMTLIYFRARSQEMPCGARVSFQEKMQKTVYAVPAIIAVVILVGGIISGMATPTEVSTVAVIYALFLSVCYREMDLRKCWNMMLEASVMTSMVLFIICAGSAFSWTLTVARVPHELASLLALFHGSSWLFMVFSLLLLIPCGSMLEGLPAVLIFGPLLVPVATQFGISSLQYGIFLIIALGTGVFIPPVGMGAYFCSAIVKTTIEDLSKHMLPYLAIIIVGLLLIAFVPWFSLVLPKAFHLI